MFVSSSSYSGFTTDNFTGQTSNSCLNTNFSFTGGEPSSSVANNNLGLSSGQPSNSGFNSNIDGTARPSMPIYLNYFVESPPETQFITDNTGNFITDNLGNNITAN